MERRGRGAADRPDVTSSASSAAEAVVRTEYSRILATLIRVTGDVDRAEDAVQDAIVRALDTWPRDGIPDQPRAWLTVAARRCAIDRIRREIARTGKEAEAMSLAEDDPTPLPDSIIRDDLLRLIFTCCHPSLSLEAQVALSLRTLGGLTTPEVARALLIPEPTVAKRLTRAKQKIRQAGIPYRVPGDAELPERLAAALATVYLMFNEGYASGSGGEAVRTSLVDEAIRLGELLHELMPDEPSVTGLLALMLLQDSRRDARVNPAGVPITLADQDRTRWDRAAIRRGVELVGEGLRRTPDHPDAYVVQAAIAACHALAPDYPQTDWAAVVSWYDVLLTCQPSPAARLGRASAIAERDGPEAGLAAVEAVEGLESHAWRDAARAELLVRLGRSSDAEAALASAVALGLNEGHAAHLRSRMSRRGEQV